ncbi:hypothetical protein JNW88_31125, partial [Micromonospora sp. ATA32]|nr:hypothetical protein [Micromonospora sp. ATA32]
MRPAGPWPTAIALVELAVPAAQVTGTVARLRAEGHHFLRVRPEAPVAAPGRTVDSAEAGFLLDVEPDVQRRLARVVVGARRERWAGLLAAGVAALGTVAVALVFPWLVGGVSGPVGPGDWSVPAGVVLGLWAHLLAVPAAAALGALASRVS